MEHIHFVGIGGAGLSAIAQVLIEKGFTVSGSDHQHSPAASALERAGARVAYDHDQAHVAGASRLIRSSAIPDDNPEIQAAQAAGIPILKRADFLPELLRGYKVLAVAGTHGKTTTTAMLAWMLASGGLDPSYIIGSIANNLGHNAHAGTGPHFVIEADEYDRMFLGIQADIAVITNIEHDHPDCFPTPVEYQRAFQDFIDGIRPDGKLVYCLDDQDVARIGHKSSSKGGLLSYAIHASDANYTAHNLHISQGSGYTFDVYRKSERLATLTLQVPGVHNVSNALAAMVVMDALGLSITNCVSALAEFSGTERRFQVIGKAAGITIIDDYAHHPTEIRTTLSAARSSYPEARLWVIWQPHTYSRTRQLFDAYTTAFYEADHLIVTDIYAARESPPPDGFSSQRLIAAIDHPSVAYIGDFETATATLLERLSPGDVLMVLSAGDANLISQLVLAGLSRAERQNHVKQ